MKPLHEQLAEALKELRDALATFTAGPYLRPGETNRVHQAIDKATTALADHRAASEEQPESEAMAVCYEAYQVVGSMLNDLGQFETDRATKVLDNLSQARKVHDDVLPWPSFAQLATTPIVYRVDGHEGTGLQPNWHYHNEKPLGDKITVHALYEASPALAATWSGHSVVEEDREMDADPGMEQLPPIRLPKKVANLIGATAMAEGKTFQALVREVLVEHWRLVPWAEFLHEEKQRQGVSDRNTLPQAEGTGLKRHIRAAWKGFLDGLSLGPARRMGALIWRGIKAAFQKRNK
jgi:hypothetical protein